MKARTKFLVGSGIIVVTLCMLAYVGFTQSKTYYHTISEVADAAGCRASPAHAGFGKRARRIDCSSRWPRGFRARRGE